MVFRRPDPTLSAPREAELAALRQLERRRQLEAEAKFHAELRRPRKRGPLHRVITVLGLTVTGMIGGCSVGHHAWEAQWFDQTRGDMVGGMQMPFDMLVGGLSGLIALLVFSLLLTKNKQR